MRKIYFIIVLIVQLSFAQAPAIEWQKSLGGTGDDFAQSIQQTTDGGYIVAGFTRSNDGDVTGNHGDNDAWVVKLSSTGAIEWQKTLGGTNGDAAYSIQQTADGGYILTGYTTSYDGDISGNHGYYDYWVVKLSSTGVIQWQKTLGGTADELPYSIQQTSDGGYIVAGITDSNNGDITGNHGGRDYWIVKLSSTGTIQWQKALGGTGDDFETSMQKTADGGCIVAGWTVSNDGDVTGIHGNEDYWVVKLTSTGAIEWQKTLGGTGDDYAASVQQTADGGYIVAGQTNSNDGDVTGNHGDYDYWVVKINSSGTVEWQKTLGGTSYDVVHSIQQTTNGNYILSGITGSNDGDVTGNNGYQDCWVVKLSSTGTLLWQKALGGSTSEEAYSIQETNDGGCIIAAYTQSNDGDVTGNHGSEDYWIVKLSPDALDTTTFATNQIQLFPNPTTSTVTLQNPNNLSFDKISITDLPGKKVLEQEQNSTQINVEKLASGMYILQAFSGEKQFVSKFVKE
jgi:hypothetical protein